MRSSGFPARCGGEGLLPPVKRLVIENGAEAEVNAGVASEI